MAAGALVSVYASRQAAARVDAVVASSLERERLIGLLRLDSALLISAADDHINAADDEERRQADTVMDVNFAEIRETTLRYSAQLPKSEADLWQRLRQASERLVDMLDDTVKASNRREAERARKQLEEGVKPILFEVDKVASELARTNADETRKVLKEVQSVRAQASLLGSAAIAAAIVLSLLVAVQVVRALRRQGRVIDAQLKELNRRNAELDAFASRVAHDLIAPLSPLKGYLTMARRQVSEPDTKDILEQAESATKRVSELVEALLRFCRSGKQSDGAPAALDVAVETILLEQAQAAQMADVSLQRSVKAGVVVQCPRQLLQSVAQNVISNAVKYTAGHPKASVQVRVFEQGAFGVLEVEDSGPGISLEAQAHVFEPFFRAPETRHVVGTGLGLATTKRLVDAHGGSIDIDSTPARGTRVSVRIPLATAAQREKMS